MDQIVKKDMSLQAVEKAVVLSKKVGIKVGCFFVIGLMGETKQDIDASINYAYKLRKLGAEGFHFSIVALAYGTELYEQAKTGGLLRSCFGDEALAAAEPLIKTPEFTADDLRELCAKANLVNPTFTREKILRAIGNPGKALKALLEIVNIKQKHDQAPLLAPICFFKILAINQTVVLPNLEFSKNAE